MDLETGLETRPAIQVQTVTSLAVSSVSLATYSSNWKRQSNNKRLHQVPFDLVD